MKKILVILNGPFTPQHVVNAAISIAKSTSSLLHVVFLNYSFQIADYNYPFPNDLSLTRNRLTGKTLTEENADLLSNSVNIFKHECETMNVGFVIDAEIEISLGKLIEYSAFSDFILADGKADLYQYHLVDILVNSQCPVYLITKDIKLPEIIILAYDGSYSSIKAIKMFSYVFSELKNLPTFLVHISPDRNEIVVPEEENLKLWARKHFANIQIKIFHGETEKELVSFISSHPNSLVVMGAYGRTALSRLFHKSLASTVISNTESSLYISHN